MKLLILLDKSFLKNNPGIDVSKYEKEKALTISDSLERYFGDQQLDDKSFKMNLVNYAMQIGRNGLRF
jgi:hypothetical protein